MCNCTRNERELSGSAITLDHFEAGVGPVAHLDGDSVGGRALSESNVAALRPATKAKDPTAALRARRAANATRHRGPSQVPAAAVERNREAGKLAAPEGGTRQCGCPGPLLPRLASRGELQIAGATAANGLACSQSCPGPLPKFHCFNGGRVAISRRSIPWRLGYCCYSLKLNYWEESHA
jgi:hypothetical protein